MTSYTFTVPGRPCPAVRMTQKTKHRKGGSEERHLAHKSAIGWEAKKAHVREIEGPVCLTATFYVAAPEPDLGNLVKLVEDALQGIAFANDRQVCAYGRGTRRVLCPRSEQRTVVTIEADQEVPTA